jgi:hypothetical protein
MNYFFTDKVTNTSGKLINTDELIELIKNPPKVDGNYITAKANSACIGGHDLPTSKRKADVLEHDSFTMLRLDLDDNAPELDEISEELKALGLSLFFIYSTAKHKQIDTETGEDYGNRYRVIVPLRKSMHYKKWELSQIGLSIPFESDSCADRPQQIMYLPTRYDGDRYEFKLVNEGENQPETIKALHGNGLKVKQEQLEDIKKLSFKPQFNEKLEGNSISIIDTFSAQFSVEDVLRQFGYECKSGRWLSPFSKSGIAGGGVLTSNKDGKRRYYTHSESEQNALNLAKGRSFDAFDMYCYLKHSGDQFEAVQEVATTFFPQVDKHNKREYRIKQQNERVSKELQAKEGEA